jgi:hypothetical protein
MCFCVKSDHISFATIVQFVDFGSPYGLLGTCGSLHNLNHHLAFTSTTWFQIFDNDFWADTLLNSGSAAGAGGPNLL